MTLKRESGVHDSHEESPWLSRGVTLTLMRSHVDSIYTESDHSYDFFPEFKTCVATLAAITLSSRAECRTVFNAD